MRQVFYSPTQTINAFNTGMQQREQRQAKKVKNAFSQMIGENDLEGARKYAYGQGNLELGQGADALIAGQQQQEATANSERSRRAYEGVKAIMGQTDFNSRLQMATTLSQQLGIPAPDDPNDLTDHALTQQLEALRIEGGFEADAPIEGKAINNRLVDPRTGTVMADFSDPAGPLSTAGKTAHDLNQGYLTPEQYKTATTKAPAASVTVQNNPTPGQYAESLLTPPQTKGKDPAIVFDSEGFARVSPNAQQQGLNKAALKFNDLAAKNALVSDDINRALEHFTIVDPETGVRSVNPDQKSVGIWAAAADIPFFGGSTEAGSMQSFLTTLQANVGFGELQAMREASPTGGALGQVSEREIAFLQALLGDIEQSRDPKILMYNLERLQTFMDGRQQRFREAFEADYPTLGETVSREQGARDEVNDLLNMYAPEGGS